MEWREEVELELGSSLSGKSNSVKSNYVLRWAGKPARDYLKSLPKSEFKYEGASAESILQALEQKTKPKSNAIAAFTKLRSLKQGDMPLSEFIHEARRLAELCNYLNDKDRLIRDAIVSGIQSLRAYQKCIDAKDLSLQDCINICQPENAVRMQVLECRPESVKSIQSAQTAVPVHRLQNGSRQSSNSNRNKNKTACNCYYCGAQNWTREHSKMCKAKNHTCGRCNKKGHLDSLCRSAGTPLHMIYQSTAGAVSGDSARLQSKSRGCTILHTVLHVQRRITTDYLQQPQDCSSLQTGRPTSRVNTSGRPGSHSLRTLRSTS